MKKTHIIGIVIIAVALGVIVSTMGSSSTYVSFKEARDLALEGQKEKVHIVGTLLKDDQGKILGIHPSEDKLSFSFVMVDENKEQTKVVYAEPMPADFTKSDKIVVIGNFEKDRFVADKILLKCPSKYQDQDKQTASIK